MNKEIKQPKMSTDAPETFPSLLQSSENERRITRNVTQSPRMLFAQILKPFKPLDFSGGESEVGRERSNPISESSAPTAKGIWDERSKTRIRPSGTVKQGRRPMFKPFTPEAKQ